MSWRRGRTGQFEGSLLRSRRRCRIGRRERSTPVPARRRGAAHSTVACVACCVCVSRRAQDERPAFVLLDATVRGRSRSGYARRGRLSPRADSLAEPDNHSCSEQQHGHTPGPSGGLGPDESRPSRMVGVVIHGEALTFNGPVGRFAGIHPAVHLVGIVDPEGRMVWALYVFSWYKRLFQALQPSPGHVRFDRDPCPELPLPEGHPCEQQCATEKRSHRDGFEEGPLVHAQLSVCGRRNVTR